jgi:Zinc carboxypeptidase
VDGPIRETEAKRMRSTLITVWLAIAAAGLVTGPASAQGEARPGAAALPELAYDVDFFPGTAYDPAVPTPESVLGFRPGDRAAFPAEIERCLEVWKDSPRARLTEYARSHEGRALYLMAVSSPANIARLDEIQTTAARLADPRGLSDAEAASLLESQPAIAWTAYSIHGDETSGSDAALAVLYHLLAGAGPEVEGLLDRLVVLVDPMQNPDGRHRFLQQVAEHRATTPNVDDQSLVHGGYWPWGRANHYLFDLNRDWTPAVHPESRGRIRAAGAWHPQIMVDAHEMGAQDTYLFAPPLGPDNPLVPDSLHRWGRVFARDQSRAFDRWKWTYYTGEWNEGWYPGYTDAWGQFRGALGILYEQAGFSEDGVRQAGRGVMSYRESVHHQAVSSIANLTTLADNRRAMLDDFLRERKRNVAADSPWASRTFAVLPSANLGRLASFLDLMELQGIEVYAVDQPTVVEGAVDQYGRTRGRTALPAGTFLIPNRQPEAHLVSTMLEFDGRMPPEYLERERTAIVRDGSSTIYDITAWSTTMFYGLDALTLAQGLPAGARRWQPGATPALAPVPADAVAWIVDGRDDRSVAFAARLLERGAGVRVADRDLELGDQRFERGSIVVLPSDNRRLAGDLTAMLEETGAALDLPIGAVTTGLGEGDLPDIGGGHFRRLEAPRIALLARGGVNASDFGSIWYLLDMDLGIRHSELDETALNFVDLRRYNVVVLPDRYFGELPEAARTGLRSWVEAGGTLIAIGDSAAQAAREEGGLSAARRLRDVVGDAQAYADAVLRETMALEGPLPPASRVWSYTAEAGGTFPWEGTEDLAAPSKEEAARADAWNRMFMPQGAFLAARTDPEHWLTLGVGRELPVLVNASTALLAKPPVEAPVRLGVLEASPGAAARRVGWSVVPAGHDLRLRMSGLLWPEAAGRLANSAAVTREGVGKGQIILFANSPTFRGVTRGTARLLLNALVYGPGLGAESPIAP